MNYAWRTSTVVELCAAMRQDNDYSATPILADALQDADCDDEALMAKLRGPLEPLVAQAAVAMIYSDETAGAVEWVKQFVRDINYRDDPKPSLQDVTFEDIELWHSVDGDDECEAGSPSDTDPHDYIGIMEDAERSLECGYMSFGTDEGADYFRRPGQHNVREFFRKWSLITGLPAPEELQDKIRFSCSC